MDTDAAIQSLEQTPLPSSNEQKKLSQVQVLLEMCASGEFFHTPDGEAYATVVVGGHKETWQLRSKGFRGWLGKTYYDKRSSSHFRNLALRNTGDTAT